MIAEAVDTAWTLGWALLAWIAVLSAGVTLLLLGSAAVVWRAAAWLRARLRAEVPGSGAGLLRTRERPAQRRLRLPGRGAWPTTPSSRRGSRGCGAPQTPDAGFPAPDRPEPPQRRSRPSWANTQPINYEEAA